MKQKLWKKSNLFWKKSSNQKRAASRWTADKRRKAEHFFLIFFFSSKLYPTDGAEAGGELQQGMFYVKVAPSRSFPRRNNLLCNVPLTFLLSSLFCFKRVSQKVWKGPQDYVIIAFIVFTFLHSKTHSKSHLLVFYSHPLLWFNFPQYIIK